MKPRTPVPATIAMSPASVTQGAPQGIALPTGRSYAVPPREVVARGDAFLLRIRFEHR